MSREDMLSLIEEQRRYFAGEVAQEEISARLRSSLELGYPNWTTSEDGHENSSPEFKYLIDEVARLICEGGGWALDQSWVCGKAGLIMAQLAHVHHLAPISPSACDKTTPPQSTATGECGIEVLESNIGVTAKSTTS